MSRCCQELEAAWHPLVLAAIPKKRVGAVPADFPSALAGEIRLADFGLVLLVQREKGPRPTQGIQSSLR